MAPPATSPKQDRKGCCFTPCCWAPCCFLGSIAYALLGIWGYYMWHRFDPIYTEISCHLKNFKIVKMKPIPFYMGLTVGVECNNPNPYGIKLVDSVPGYVLIGPKKTKATLGLQLPDVELPAYGMGTIPAGINVSLTRNTNVGAFFRFLGSKTQVRMELNLAVAVNVRFFFGGSFKTKLPFTKDCGMEVTGLSGLMFQHKRARLGPFACADSWEELKVPKINEASRGPMVFDTLKIAPDEIGMGTTAKTIGLGSMMFIGFGLSLVFMCCSIRCCCRMRKTGDGGPEAKLQATPRAAVAESTPQPRV